MINSNGVYKIADHGVLNANTAYSYAFANSITSDD